MDLLAYIGSKQYRSLFKPQYAAVVKSRNLPLSYGRQSEPQECSSQIVFGFGAILKVEVQSWNIVESAINEGHGLVMLTPHLRKL